MLSNFINHKYLPILITRPEEMNALEQLSPKTKNFLTPVLLLQPWQNSLTFEVIIKRVEKAIGKKKRWIANLNHHFNDYDSMTDAKREFLALTSSDNGYNNWVEFLSEHPNLIPCLQLHDLSQFQKQLNRLARLKRGLVLHLTRENFFATLSKDNLAHLKSATKHNKLLILLDFETIRPSDDLTLLSATFINKIREVSETPEFIFSVSATSFPDSFGTVIKQDIKERELYNIFRRSINAQLIYSDHGSARVKSQGGGSGIIYARIDLPTYSDWKFFRSPLTDRNYREMAKMAVNSKDWDPDLKIWGTRLIEDTANDRPDFISSPVRATAARINIHMHRQVFFGDEVGLRDTEVPYTDDED